MDAVDVQAGLGRGARPGEGERVRRLLDNKKTKQSEVRQWLDQLVSKIPGNSCLFARRNVNRVRNKGSTGKIAANKRVRTVAMRAATIASRVSAVTHTP